MPPSTDSSESSPESSVPSMNAFRVFCPRCGSDSDAEDKVFLFGCPLLAPHADLVLMAIHCSTCQQDFDIALWPVEPERFMKKESNGGELQAYATPDAMVLMWRWAGS